MKLVFNFSSGHVDNIHTNYFIVSRSSCPPFWFMLKTFRPCSEKVMDFVMIDKTVSAYHSNEFEAWCQNDTWGCISGIPWHIDTKLCVCHCHLTQNTPHRFDNGATYWSKVKSHSITIARRLEVFNYFSAIFTSINIKWLQLLIAVVGPMLASVVLGPVIAACSYIYYYYYEACHIFSVLHL